MKTFLSVSDLLLRLEYIIICLHHCQQSCCSLRFYAVNLESSQAFAVKIFFCCISAQRCW